MSEKKQNSLLNKLCPLCYRICEVIREKKEKKNNQVMITWKQTIQQTLSASKVVIFSKDYCPFCRKAKKVFTDLNQKFTILEINLVDPKGDFQKALIEFTGQRTVPYVFIDGKLLGGADDTQIALKNGKLKKLLSNLKQTKAFRMDHHKCSGMFWRNHPNYDQAEQKGNQDWPKNGAILVGVLRGDVDKKMTWLEVKKWKQAESEKWVENCLNCWMPFQQFGVPILKIVVPEKTKVEKKELMSFTMNHFKCSGMFWRNHPLKEGDQKGNEEWPRNGSVLIGLVHEEIDDNLHWLEVKKWKQVKTSEWIDECKNLWMPLKQYGTQILKKD